MAEPEAVRNRGRTLRDRREPAMKYLLLLVFLVGCQAPKPATIEEARSGFYWTIEKARQRPCVPDYVEEAYQNLANLAFQIETEDEVEWNRFIVEDEQEYSRFKQGVCNENPRRF